MSPLADELFARYVERLVVGDERLSLEELAGGDAELQASLHRRIEAFFAIKEALGRRPPLTGSSIGPYEILARLGAGGTGEVYRARDTRLGREVALKVLPALFAFDPQRRGRLQREARLLAAVRHPSVAAIYGIEEAGERTCLVLELVTGETLAERLGRGPLPLPQALRLLDEVAAGLEAAHARGILHRDLKPANIQITPDGHAKVLDFSLGKEFGAKGADGAPPTLTRLGRTLTGTILGTASYMSPEQARGRDLDGRTDVWSFGCVVYEVLAGRRAFPGATFTDAVARVLLHEPDWRALPAEVSREIRRLIRHCLEKDPERRLGSMGAARAALAHGLGQGLSRRRVRPATAFAAALAMLLALATILPAPRRDRPTLRAPVAPPPAVPAPAPRPPVSSTTANPDPGAYRLSLAAAYSRWRETYERGHGAAGARDPLAYVASHHGVEVVSALSNTVIANIPFGAQIAQDLPGPPGLAPDGTRVYVAVTGKAGRVFVIDTRSKALLTVPDGVGIRVEDQPVQVVLTGDGARAYVCHLSGHLVVIDTDPARATYHQRLAVPEGRSLRLPGRLRALSLSPDGARLYVLSDSPGRLSVIDVDPRSPTFHRRLAVPDGEAIPIGRSPRDYLSFAPDGARLYFTDVLSDDLWIVDTRPGSPTFHRLLARIAVPSYPLAVAVTPDGRLAYVVSRATTNVTTLDTASASTVFEPIEVGVSPAAIAFTPDGTRGFISNFSSRTLSVIDTDPRSPTFRTVVATVRTRGTPLGIVVGPAP